MYILTRILQFTFIFCIFMCVKASENLALHKNTTQSSTSGGRVSRNAVDGNRSQVWESYSCVHTDFGPNITYAWWQVDLGNLSEITEIKIYYREGFAARLNGYTLEISNQSDFTHYTACYEDKTPELPSENPVHICKYVGRFVRLTIGKYGLYEEKYGAVINLCEMEVYGCPIGFYGNGNCNTPCGDGCGDQRCNPNNGTCYYCSEKYYGTSCSIDCPRDCNKSCDAIQGTCIHGCKTHSFGLHCDLTCPENCESGECDQATGQCNGECNADYYGSYCNSTCPPGCKNNKCRKGKCTEGCISGFNGNKCEDCIDGMYGFNCTLPCSSNCKNNICDRTNGSCVYGCLRQEMDGYNCEDCKPGYHGVNCSSICPENCNNVTCEKLSGNCLSGCNGNFDGPTCEACKREYYTSSCNMSCPASCHGRGCNQTNGNCYNNKCVVDGVSSYCTTLSDSSKDPTYIAIGIVCGIIFIGIIITVFIVFFRRRKPKQRQGLFNNSKISGSKQIKSCENSRTPKSRKDECICENNPSIRERPASENHRQDSQIYVNDVIYEIPENYEPVDEYKSTEPVYINTQDDDYSSRNMYINFEELTAKK